jgi:thymidylate kinase
MTLASAGVLIVEGVTGAGKSSLIRALQAACPGSPGAIGLRVIDEDATLGKLMSDVSTPAWRASPTFPALDAALETARRWRAETPGALILLERFHLTPYALSVPWPALDRYDRALAELGAVHVLLDYPPALVEERSIRRVDRSDEEWASPMIAQYGTLEAAVRAVRRSQERRRSALTRSRLSFLHFDTSGQRWQAYASTILAYCGW